MSELLNSYELSLYTLTLFLNPTLWIFGKEKKLLATPLTLLIPRLIPVSVAVVWETSHTKPLFKRYGSHSYRWILLALWASGRYRDSRKTVRLSSLLILFAKGRDKASLSLFLSPSPLFSPCAVAKEAMQLCLVCLVFFLFVRLRRLIFPFAIFFL